jgi:hypothetical protein
MTASLVIVTEVRVVQEDIGGTLASFPLFPIQVIVGPLEDVGEDLTPGAELVDWSHVAVSEVPVRQVLENEVRCRSFEC